MSTSCFSLDTVGALPPPSAGRSPQTSGLLAAEAGEGHLWAGLAGWDSDPAVPSRTRSPPAPGVSRLIRFPRGIPSGPASRGEAWRPRPGHRGRQEGQARVSAPDVLDPHCHHGPSTCFAGIPQPRDPTQAASPEPEGWWRARTTLSCGWGCARTRVSATFPAAHLAQLHLTHVSRRP